MNRALSRIPISLHLGLYSAVEDLEKKTAFPPGDMHMVQAEQKHQDNLVTSVMNERTIVGRRSSEG